MERQREPRCEWRRRRRRGRQVGGMGSQHLGRGQGLGRAGIAERRIPSCGFLYDTSLLLQFCNGELAFSS